MNPIDVQEQDRLVDTIADKYSLKINEDQLDSRMFLKGRPTLFIWVPKTKSIITL